MKHAPLGYKNQSVSAV